MKYLNALRNATGCGIMLVGALLLVPGVLVVAIGACLTDFFRVEKYEIKDS